MNKNPKHVLLRLFKYSRYAKKNLIIACIISLIITVVELLPVFINAEIIRVLESRTNYDRIIVLLSLGALSVIVVCSGMYISAIMFQKVGQEIVYKIRCDLFKHVSSYSIAQIISEPIGKYVTRITNDTNAINELFTNVFINIMKGIFSVIVVLSLMFYASVKLALIILCVTPLLIIASILFRYFSRKAYRNVRTNLGVINGFLSENISGMKTTQIFCQEDKVYDYFKADNKKLLKSSLFEIYTIAIFRPLVFCVLLISRALIIYFGAREVIESNHAFDIAAFVAFYELVERFYNPIQNLVDQYNLLQSSLAAGEKIFTILDTKLEIVDNVDAIEAPRFVGEIEFRNVYFAYANDDWILKNVSFHIKPNQTIAFVGATGAGKTTILGLLVRNYEIQRGEILIDGVNITKYTLDSLRKNIGQMMQDVFLFSGTIKDNITLFDDEIPLEDVRSASEYVNAASFINRLDDGYGFLVRERGNNFSAGQRQLISFARTLVHKPSIMILDEATANIDTETEKLIQESLKKMMKSGTMLIVAHRLSTIQHADCIMVIKQGEIVEHGRHQELLAKRGLYYSLYELQYKNLETDL